MPVCQLFVTRVNCDCCRLTQAGGDSPEEGAISLSEDDEDLPDLVETRRQRRRREQAEKKAASKQKKERKKRKVGFRRCRPRACMYRVVRLCVQINTVNSCVWQPYVAGLLKAELVHQLLCRTKCLVA